MKPEKEPKQTTAEKEKMRFDKPIDEIRFEDEKNELLLGFKKLINQGVAMLDFEKDRNGGIESVTITRRLGGEMLFHANNKSWTGQEDIRRVLGMISSGRPD